MHAYMFKMGSEGQVPDFIEAAIMMFVVWFTYLAYMLIQHYMTVLGVKKKYKRLRSQLPHPNTRPGRGEKNPKHTNGMPIVIVDHLLSNHLKTLLIKEAGLTRFPESINSWRFASHMDHIYGRIIKKNLWQAAIAFSFIALGSLGEALNYMFDVTEILPYIIYLATIGFLMLWIGLSMKRFAKKLPLKVSNLKNEMGVDK